MNIVISLIAWTKSVKLNDQTNYDRYIARTLSDEDDDNEASEETPRSFEPRLLGLMPDTSEKVYLGSLMYLALFIAQLLTV
jgi:hypothetical protein